MKRFARAALVAALMSLAPCALAQAPEPPVPAAVPTPVPNAVPTAVPTPVPTAVPTAVPKVVLVASPAARPVDVASVDAIIAALYDVVSGPAGKVRDWDRLRSLFIPDGKMGVVGAKVAGGFFHRAMSVDDYIARTTKPFSEAGFFETELARTSDTFGQVTHVFSTYEARKAPADARPFMRGVNSLQLYHDGVRWWIISLLWRAEDDKLSLPEKYLKSH